MNYGEGNYLQNAKSWLLTKTIVTTIKQQPPICEIFFVKFFFTNFFSQECETFKSIEKYFTK